MKPVDSALGSDLRLRRLFALLQLASPALPVGGYAYSQGLEKAIEDGLVCDAASARRWIADLLLLVIARYEAALWLRVFDAAATGDTAAVAVRKAELLASRETAELRAESLQMGTSLARVFPVLGLEPPAGQVAYPAAFALACVGLGIDREAGLAAYLWAWLENQVLVAVKSVPLGQQAGQSLLFGMHEALAQAVASATALSDDELGSAPLRFALTSARHETQYSRIYRS
jgi:urease accessory protein